MHLPFDDSDGVTVTHDIAGLSYDGLWTNCPLFEVQGRCRQCAVFDGVDDYVAATSVSGAHRGGSIQHGCLCLREERLKSIAARSSPLIHQPVITLMRCITSQLQNNSPITTRHLVLSMSSRFI